jgi:hypothetical protein
MHVEPYMMKKFVLSGGEDYEPRHALLYLSLQWLKQNQLDTFKLIPLFFHKQGSKIDQ